MQALWVEIEATGPLLRCHRKRSTLFWFQLIKRSPPKKHHFFWAMPKLPHPPAQNLATFFSLIPTKKCRYFALLKTE